MAALAISGNSFVPSLRSEENKQKINTKPLSICFHLLVYPISSQVTIGLAKIFNFEVLTHGTSIKNAYGILKNGADPSRGGTKIGSTTFVAEGKANDPTLKETLNNFYVFKDTQAKKECTEAFIDNRPFSDKEGSYVYIDANGKEFDKPQYKEMSYLNSVALYLMPRFHAMLSGIAHTTDIKNKFRKRTEQIFYGALNGLLSPTLRFVYTPDEVNQIFEIDPHYAGVACRTIKKLPNNRIGLIGVCQHANIQGLKTGLQERPVRVLVGVIQLVVGLIFTYKVFELLSNVL